MLVAILAILGTALFVGGMFYYFNVYKKRKVTSWVIKGKAPPFFWEAMAIIAKHTPGLPQAGYITWVDGPFMTGGVKAMGVVETTQPNVIIKVTYVDPIENSALSHELEHAWRGVTGLPFMESPRDPEFVKWFTEVNAEIKAARLASPSSPSQA